MNFNFLFGCLYFLLWLQHRDGKIVSYLFGNAKFFFGRGCSFETETSPALAIVDKIKKKISLVAGSVSCVYYSVTIQSAGLSIV